MARQKKRSRKFLGTRNHGTGNKKNRRGKGGKGGWGRAGMHKQRFSYITRYEPDFFGVHGFAGVRTVRLPTTNLYEIEQLAVGGKLETREGKLFYEFDGKILGSGKITRAVAVKCLAFSEGAEKKIKAAGGSITAPAKKEKKAKPAPAPNAKKQGSF